MNEENHQIKVKYSNFDVLNESDKYTFLHTSINTDDFYEMIIKYFFDNERLLKYISNRENVQFVPTKKNYVQLYKNIKYFIDSENESTDIDKFYEELGKYIDLNVFEESEILKFRRDKSGKIGEYIFSIILLEYFNMTCILPKIKLTTDYNMSVFGIDTLFYSNEKDMILFGESKFYENLSSGVTAINASLKNYEKQIEEEYTLVLSNDIYGLRGIEKYKDNIEQCVSFKDFIKDANIKVLGIPIFVIHGGDYDSTNILNELNKVNRKMFFNLPI